MFFHAFSCFFHFHPKSSQQKVLLVAHDVEEGLLLPREGRVRQILRRGRAAHREGELLVAARDTLPLGLGSFPSKKQVWCQLFFDFLFLFNWCNLSKTHTVNVLIVKDGLSSLETGFVHPFTSNESWHVQVSFSSSSKSCWKGVSMILSRIALPTWTPKQMKQDALKIHQESRKFCADRCYPKKTSTNWVGKNTTNINRSV